MKKEYSPLAKTCIDALRKSLKQFGEYSFFDKGPREVMDIDEIVVIFKQNDIEKCIAAFKEILEYKKYGETLASAILAECQDWDELWENNTEFLSSFL